MKLMLLALLFLSTTAFGQWSNHFTTRLAPDLSIEGVRCEGELISPDCQEGQWLITVDDMNVCSEESICTQIYVEPFVAQLVEVPVTTIATYTLYEISPISIVNAKTHDILGRFQVKFDLNEEPMVVERE